MRVTDTKLRRIAHQFRKGLLGSRASRLNCFIVCAPLQGYLSACGIGTDIVEGFPSGGDVSNHVWLRLSDGRVLDPTADQFGPQYPPIYIGEPLEFHKLTPTCAACHKRLPEDCIFDSATGERVHYECQEGKDGGRMIPNTFDKTPNNRLCRRCGAGFASVCRIVKYCATCRQIVNKEQQRRAIVRLRAKRRATA